MWEQDSSWRAYETSASIVRQERRRDRITNPTKNACLLMIGIVAIFIESCGRPTPTISDFIQHACTAYFRKLREPNRAYVRIASSRFSLSKLWRKDRKCEADFQTV